MEKNIKSENQNNANIMTLGDALSHIKSKTREHLKAIMQQPVSIDSCRVIQKVTVSDERISKTTVKGKEKINKPFSFSDLTPDKGEWITAKKFREINGNRNNRTLQDWRRKGKKNADKSSGCDSKGNIWRKTPAKNRTEYWQWYESNEKSKRKSK